MDNKTNANINTNTKSINTLKPISRAIMKIKTLKSHIMSLLIKELS